MKSNNNKTKIVDVEAQIFETNIPIISIIPFTRNVKVILSFILFQVVIVLSLVFMFHDHDSINSLQHQIHQRAPLSADTGYPLHVDTGLPLHADTANTLLSLHADPGLYPDDHIPVDLAMQPYIQWTEGVTICILSDFEYDDIVLIGSLLMHAMRELSHDPFNPNLNSIIDNLQIIYFAHNEPKKDGNGLWRKKLAMAHYFFPPSVYNKIVIRWKNPADDPNKPTEPLDYQQWQPYTSSFNHDVDKMKEKVDMIVIGPGHGNLDEINNLMKEKGKSINRFMMSVGAVNPREDQTTPEDIEVLFEWAKQSKNQQFVDSSRFPWMAIRSAGQVHELGGKTEMERLLAQSGGEHVVMDYLDVFNLGALYNGAYPGVGEKQLCQPDANKESIMQNMETKQAINALKEQLEESGLVHETLREFAEAIIQDTEIQKYLKVPFTGFTDDAEWRRNENWKLDQMDKDKCWAAYKLKRILQYLNGEKQDGPAADPVMAYWHWFPNEHKLMHGRMIKDSKDCEFTKKEVKDNGLFNSGLRMMVSNEKFDQIKGWKRGCKSRGEMIQITLKQKFETREEFLEHYQEHWRQMFAQFLDFRNMKVVIDQYR